jgi:hypothetical protein
VCRAIEGAAGAGGIRRNQSQNLLTGSVLIDVNWLESGLLRF